MGKKNILYVIGSPRSGSTLIYNALCSDNKTNPPLPESHLVDKIASIYAYQFNRLEIEKDYIFDDEKDIVNYLNKSMKIFFDKIIKKYNTDTLILKSIVCSPNAHILHHIFPKISFILCVRDPRDIVNSMINIGKRQAENGIDAQFTRNIEQLCRRINDSYRILFEKKLSKNFFNSLNIVKYEDFVKNPSDILNKISLDLSLKIKFKKKLSTWKRNKEVYRNYHYGYQSKLWNKPISDKNIGAYKKNLTKKEIVKINDLCSNLISRFDYII